MWIDINEIFIKLWEESGNSKKNTKIKEPIGRALKEKKILGYQRQPHSQKEKKNPEWNIRGGSSSPESLLYKV